MSTDYEFRCVTCTDDGHGHAYGLDNWRSPEQLDALLRLRASFAAIGRSTEGLWLWGWDAHGSMFPAVFHFFAEHDGHDVRVFDEYGRDWARRDEMCVCGHKYDDHYAPHRDNAEGCIYPTLTGSRCPPHRFERAKEPHHG